MKWIGENQVSKFDVGFVNRKVTIVENVLIERSLLTQPLNDIEYIVIDSRELYYRRHEASFYRNSVLDTRIIPYMQQFGFYGVTRLGLPIDGVAVCGSTCLDWREVCATLLGVVLEDGDIYGQRLSLTWLIEHFLSLAPDADVESVRCFLFVDKSNNMVHLIPDTPNIGHRDEIHQLCTITLEAIHEVDRLLILPNVVDTKRQSSDEKVVMRGDKVRTRGGGVRTKGGWVRIRGDGMIWRHECNTFLYHLLNNSDRTRFKIKDVDEEMKQH
ncbi:hypothetical protein AAG906_039633 [Vitis piasezkii]